MTQERLAFIIISALLCFSIGMSATTWKKCRRAKNMKAFAIMLLISASYVVMLLLLTFKDEIR